MDGPDSISKCPTSSQQGEEGQGGGEDSDGEDTPNIAPLLEENEEIIKVEEGPHVDEEGSADNDGPNRSDDQLEVFRLQWKEEIESRSGRSPREGSLYGGRQDIASQGGADDLETKARTLFFQGMQAEDDGLLAEAIYYYKKALQLVPDIESRLDFVVQHSPRDRARMDSESSVEGSELEEDLLQHFENLNVKDEALCKPEYQQRMTHISSLPVELILYILHWVVSSELDFRSLDMVSRVCRGFYLCARDERIWKLGCEKVWGVNIGSAKKFGGSWRRMVIERPRLLFDGCYISKLTYIRQGEQGLDLWYRPFHLVEYYRYVRFFPNGQVLMLVSADDPVQSLPKLRHWSSKADGILLGGYKLLDSKVSCILRRVRSEPAVISRYKRHRQAASQNDSELIFCVEFEVLSNGRRHNAQLQWNSYTVKTVYKSSGEESVNSFDLNKRQFPPMFFSRVRSYAATSQEPLE